MAITVEELITEWGFKIDAKPLKRLSDSVNTVKRNILQVGTVAVATAGAIFGLAKSTALAGDSIANTSSKLGIGVEALQELRFAGERANISTITMDTALQRFTRRAAEAAAGTGEAKDALKELGVQLKDSEGNIRPTEDLLADVADGMANVEGQANKVKLAFKLFDTEGVNLVNILGKGSDALNKMRQEARETGNILSRETVASAVKFENAFQDATEVVKGMKNQIGAALIPVVTDLLKKFKSWFKANRVLIKQNISKFVKNLVSTAKTFVSILKSIFKVLNFVVKLMGGWENALRLVIAGFLTFKALQTANALRLIAGSTIQVVNGFRKMGKAALIAQLKIAAIVLLIAVFIGAIALLAEEINAIFDDKINGLLERKFPKFKQFLLTLRDQIKVIGKFFKGLFDNIVAGFKRVEALFDKIAKFRDKFKFELPKFEFPKIPFFNKDKATDNVNAAPGGQGPIIVNNEININGGDPDKVQKAVQNGTEAALEKSMRDQINNSAKRQNSPNREQ